MTCRHCGREMPPGMIGLACMVCFNRRAREALLTREYPYVQDIRQGNVQLRLARPTPKSRHWHLEFIFLAGQSYCGEPLATHWRRLRQTYCADMEHDICRNCWQALQQMLRVAA